MGGAKQKLGTVDLQTGEIMEGAFVFVPGKRVNGFKDRWFAMGQDISMLLATNPDLTGRDFRVMFGLFAKLDFENLLAISQADLSRELGISPNNLNMSIKKLINIGMLLEGPKIGVSRSYRLNPSYGWKGSAKSHVIALDEHRKIPLQASQRRALAEHAEREMTAWEKAEMSGQQRLDGVLDN